MKRQSAVKDMIRFVPLVALACLIAGCTGTRLDSFAQSVDRATGSFVQPNAQTPSLQATDNVLNNGPLRKELANILVEEDFTRAERAQKSALDNGRTGVPIAWRNPDSGRTGQVVAGPGYSINGRQCRDFTHTIVVQSEPKAVTGVACRSQTGAWEAIS